MPARLPVRTTKWASFSRRIGLFSLPILIIGVAGSRFDYFGELETLAIVGVGFSCAFAALVGALIAFVDIWKEGDRGLWSAVGGLVFGGIGFMPAVLVALSVAFYPRATDVSSDIIEPPMFSARTIDEAERMARGAAGAVIVEDLYGLPIEEPADQVFWVVDALVEARGWERVRIVPPAPGRRTSAIEVIARSPLLRMRDRATIRLTSLPGGTLVDMRSITLRGNHDFGINLRRITTFFEDLTVAVEAARAAAEQEAEAETEGQN